jgi:hypothetical protein
MTGYTVLFRSQMNGQKHKYNTHMPRRTNFKVNTNSVLNELYCAFATAAIVYLKTSRVIQCKNANTGHDYLL